MHLKIHRRWFRYIDRWLWVVDVRLGSHRWLWIP